MRLLIYRSESVEIKEFVSFWASQYDSRRYPDDVYFKYIGKRTPEAISALFEWKNGGPLPAKKKRSVKENYIDRLDEIKRLPADVSPQEFLDRFSKGGAIWRIFWLHCCRPAFPMYDQHVHRAMSFITGGQSSELKGRSEADIIALYLDSYVAFYQQFEGLELGSRQVDRALSSFGKFLKRWRLEDNPIK